jgi:hypothetical protein
MGMPMAGALINGDIVFDTAEVRKGKGERLMPPFAPARSDNGEPVTSKGPWERHERNRQKEQRVQKKWYRIWF